jgi:hypothetical protein
MIPEKRLNFIDRGRRREENERRQGQERKGYTQKRAELDDFEWLSC